MQGKGWKRVFYQKKGLHKVVAEDGPTPGTALNWGLNPGLIKFGILFLDAKFAKNKNSKLPKLSGYK